MVVGEGRFLFGRWFQIDWGPLSSPSFCSLWRSLMIWLMVVWFVALGLWWGCGGVFLIWVLGLLVRVVGIGLKGGGCGVVRCRSVWRLGWWSLLLPSLQGQWHDSLNMTCLRLQVFGQMTWDIKRVFPYYKRTQVLKDLKTPTPRKTDTSPKTTHCQPDHLYLLLVPFSGWLAMIET